MCKFAQLYACHELFRKYTGVKAQFLCQMMLVSFISNTTGCYFGRTVYPSGAHEFTVFVCLFISSSLGHCIVYSSSIYRRHDIAEKLLKLALNINQSIDLQLLIILWYLKHLFCYVTSSVFRFITFSIVLSVYSSIVYYTLEVIHKHSRCFHSA